jgi:hypothetical protein
VWGRKRWGQGACERGVERRWCVLGTERRCEETIRGTPVVNCRSPLRGVSEGQKSLQTENPDAPKKTIPLKNRKRIERREREN